MSTLQIILLSLCCATAIIFIVVRTIKGGFAGFILKTIASLAFVISSIIGLGLGTNNTWGNILIVIGLLMGLIGDMVLDLKVIYPDKDVIFLNMGMGAFFLGHISYIVAFSTLTNNTRLLMPILIAIGGGMIITLGTIVSGKKMMGLNFGNYIIQSTAYSFLLSFTLLYTLVLAIMGGGLWLTAIGFALFLLSDIVLSFQYFGGKIYSKPLIIINHALYYSAQIILLAVLFVI